MIKKKKKEKKSLSTFNPEAINLTTNKNCHILQKNFEYTHIHATLVFSCYGKVHTGSVVVTQIIGFSKSK